MPKYVGGMAITPKTRVKLLRRSEVGNKLIVVVRA